MKRFFENSHEDRGRERTDLSRRQFVKWALATSALASMPVLDSLASEVKQKADLPVVVIGAGLGGLISAAYLAKSGFPVTLLEAHDRPGGYATSFKRGDFNFEVSLHATAATNGMPEKILTEIGVWDRLTPVYTPELCRLVWPNLDITLPQRDPQGLVDLLIRQFPDQAEGIRGFMDDMVSIHREVVSGYAGSDSTMARLEKITLEDWLNQYFQNKQLQDVLSCFWAYYGAPPSKISAMYYAIATGEYMIEGGQYYKERSQDLSNILMEAIKGHGGQVLLKTEAADIGLNKDGVTGVKDTRGNSYPARAVVANAAAPVIFGRLIPRSSIPDDYLKRLDRKKPSLSSFIIWLGLKEDLRGKIPGYEIFVDGRNPEKSLEARLKGDMEKTGLAVAIYDNLYPGYSAPGKSTVSIVSLCGYQPWQKYEAAYFSGQKKDYHQEKKRVTDLLIRRAQEAIIPDLESMIEVKESASPLTNIRFTGNTGGAIYGYDLSEPRLGVRTPIKGLYLAGAWALGGGYTPAMISGRMAAKEFINDCG